MENGITFVGLDAHKKGISVALLVPGEKIPVQWEIVNEIGLVKKVAHPPPHAPQPVASPA